MNENSIAERAAPERRSKGLTDRAIVSAYRRLAPVYDAVFGPLMNKGRIAAVEKLNERPGRVLEIGVGTGISFPYYTQRMRVVGIDLSPDMLDKARERVDRDTLSQVEAVLEMDAANLAFEDESFDQAVSMYTMTVVPNPAKVMEETKRVVKPGGRIFILSHFESEEGGMKLLEGAFGPIARRIGWNPDMPVDKILGIDGLNLVSHDRHSPLGLFSLLEFERH